MNTPSKKIRFVCGTRNSRNDFFKISALGRSIKLYRNHPNVQVQLFPSNKAALPTIYNLAIENAIADPAILVFVHDDVHLVDFFWHEKIPQALESFDIVGLAGNIRRIEKQPSWALILNEQGEMVWDKPENLSGVVGHGNSFPCTNVFHYGTPGQECKLLDGMMIIADSQTLVANDLRFDPRFPFDFYDLDFCRQAEIKGLRMGTCPICTIHESQGVYGSESWSRAYAEYLNKYLE